MNVIEEMEREIGDPPKFGHRKRTRVNWPVDRIAKLIEYVKAHEELGAIRLLRSIFRKQRSTKLKEDFQKAYARFQAARNELGLIK